MSNSAIPRKSLGQHWLNDEATLEKIASYAELSKTEDVVLEIGPGLGSLTRVLLDRSKRVIAIELDDNLASKLRSTTYADNLEVVNEDILTFDLTELPSSYKVVANIPYYLSSNLIRILSESSNPPSVVVLLIQKEVAERLAAKPGDMSVLSVTAQYFWEVATKDVVKASMFIPPPKVDSQVVVLQRRTTPIFEGIDVSKFFRLVKIGFSARRKTLLNSLSNGLRGDKAVVESLIVKASLNPNIRPQNLSLKEWHQLYEVALDREII